MGWDELLASADLEPVFSPLGEERFAPGIETIYEGYLAHYGTPRAFPRGDADGGLLLGDYLYAHGLVRIAEQRDPAAVADLAELLALCAELRGAGHDGDGAVWAGSVALLGQGPIRAAGRDPAALEALAREASGADAVERALAAHALRLR
jgi:hypothetical protein